MILDQNSTTTPANTSSTTSTSKIASLPETRATLEPEDTSIMPDITSNGIMSNQTEETFPNVSSSIITLTSSTSVASDPTRYDKISTSYSLI